MGITDITDNKISDYVQEYQSESISFDGEKYVVELPWKEDRLALPTNYSIARKNRVDHTRIERKPIHIQKVR